MKKKIKTTLQLLVFFTVIYYLVTLLPISPSDRSDIKVLIIYNPLQLKEFGHILNAYRSVLEEEGIPFKLASPSLILSAEPSEIVKVYPAIILPDGIARSMPSDLKFWFKEYLEQKGNLAVIYDAGSQNLRNQFLDRGTFSDLIDLNYIHYNKLRNPNTAYTNGYVRFNEESDARFFGVPPGKTNDKHFVCGYSYGQLIYPFARVKLDGDFKKTGIKAYAVTDSGQSYPAIILKKSYSGNLLYVNLPLGHLKCNSDDLLLRGVVRSFVYNVAKVPHLMSTPGGKAGIVINWHIDWGEDREGLAYMKRNGFFFDKIKYSIHNTAGEFTDRPGDGLGFDARGKGRAILKSVVKYGTLGSHGGWAHNWYYENILSGRFKEKEIRFNIVRNNDVMKEISGYKVTEYSAPNGVHPQPLATRILEDLGVIAYYYTGDSGSAPNRTFYDKKMVSKNVIAFPVLSYISVASFYELDRDGVPAKVVEAWMNNLLKFLLEHRTVRLIYSHSYDIPPYYPNSLKKFLINVNRACHDEKLLAQSMTYFASFTRRFLKTKFRFRRRQKSLAIQLENPGGLEGVTLALPIGQYKIPDSIKGLDIRKGKEYYYLEVKEKDVEKKIYIGYSDH